MGRGLINSPSSLESPNFGIDKKHSQSLRLNFYSDIPHLMRLVDLLLRFPVSAVEEEEDDKYQDEEQGYNYRCSDHSG